MIPRWVAWLVGLLAFVAASLILTRFAIPSLIVSVVSAFIGWEAAKLFYKAGRE